MKHTAVIVSALALIGFSIAPVGAQQRPIDRCAQQDRCPIGGGRLTEHAADPAHGYAWPYLLVTPAPLVAGAPRPLGAGTLLVVPNSTGKECEDIEVVTAMATCALTFNGDINALKLADSLGTPVLMPLFLRPPDLYLHALTRASLEEKAEPRFKRVDLQLIAMIEVARAELAAKGQPVQSRVLIAGFSAAGMFTNRFAVLHADRVLAAAVGSPGGWPIAPVAVDQGDTLRYPVGIADIKDLTGHAVDLKTLRRVRFLFFLGDADDNDSVPNSDSFSAADTELINRRFGKTPVARWGPAQRLYHAAGIKGAQFKLYRGVGHKVSSKMRKDIVDTFRTALGAP
jgi:dienelactone hydrolase